MSWNSCAPSTPTFNPQKEKVMATSNPTTVPSATAHKTKALVKLERARAEIRAARAIANAEYKTQLDWDDRSEMIASLSNALRLLEEVTLTFAVMSRKEIN
jgi:hypothetical protein